MKIENMEDPGRKLKILFLTNRSPFPMVDGQSRRTYNILKGLAEKHDVYLLSLFESSYEIDPKNIQHLEAFCKKVEMLCAPSKQLSFSMVIRLLRSLISIDPYTIWRHYSPPYLKRIHELHKIREFNLIHCDILPLAYTIRDLNTPVCTITDHDVSYLKCLRMAKETPNPLLKIFLFVEALKLKKLESTIFNKIGLGIAVSEVDKQILQRISPKGKFTVIENGVNVIEFAPDSEKIVPNTLLWVGGFEHYPNKRGIYYFLENVYPMIKDNMPKIRLNLIGSGVTKKLRRFASADSSIRMLGYVDDPIPYIQKASVFIVPILSGSGTRLKILEAMAAEKAVVTTTIGCEGIGGQNDKHYIVADTPTEFAMATIKLMNDKNLRRKIGQNARRFIKEKYDWKVIWSKINYLYGELVANAN